VSSWQENVVPVSGDMNSKLALVSVVVASGPSVMIVSGGVWSIVQE
jgi:hypothetical protein